MLIAVLQCLSDFSVDHPLWTSILTVFVTAQICKWIKNSEKRFPPGPLGLPFVGYLPFLRENAHQEIARWQQTYGNVFSLNIGRRSAVVLGDFKAIREASKKDPFCGNARGLIKLAGRAKHFGGMHPKERQESYSFTRDTLNGLTKSNQLQEFATEEITKLIGKLESGIGRCEIHLRSFLLPTILNLRIFMVCGLKPTQNLELTSALNDYELLSHERFENNALAFFLPFLGPMLPHLKQTSRETKKNLFETLRLLNKEIDEREQKLGTAPGENYLDCFLQEMKGIIGDPGTFTKGVLNGNCLLLMSSGVDSTVSSIEWVLLLMAKHQDIQEKVYEEIVGQWGQTTWPAWKDFKSLPYLESVLTEAGRWKTVSPLGSPHWTLSDTKVSNYDIPKDTLIINNLQSVHMDPELWDEPDVFNPERFLTPDKKAVKEPEFFMPFSYGDSRHCPGEAIARAEILNTVAVILQHYHILPPSSGLNMDEYLRGFVLRPASPYVKVEARNGN